MIKRIISAFYVVFLVVGSLALTLAAAIVWLFILKAAGFL